MAAILEDGVVHHAGVGDSRAYLLPDAGNGRLLTIDDSMAQVMIAGRSTFRMTYDYETIDGVRVGDPHPRVPDKP